MFATIFSPHKIKRYLLWIFAIWMLIIFFNHLFTSSYKSILKSVFPPEGIRCYRNKPAPSLQDISEIRPKKGKSIFFHETSCSSHLNGQITLNARQACAVESAALLHPSHEVYLLVSAPAELLFDDNESGDVLKALLTYPNIFIKHLNFEKYTANTPLEELYKSGAIDRSEFPQSHASDVLRYLTLWKYGGIYLDLDIIVIKNLEDLAVNYAGVESDTLVNSAVLRFSPDGAGHKMVESCVYDLKEKFSGTIWVNNGPGVITRMLKKKCGANETRELYQRPCDDFEVYPADTFYAVPWWNWTIFFDEKMKNDVLQMNRNSYVIHIWNQLNYQIKIPLDEDSTRLC